MASLRLAETHAGATRSQAPAGVCGRHDAARLRQFHTSLGSPERPNGDGSCLTPRANSVATGARGRGPTACRPSPPDPRFDRFATLVLGASLAASRSSPSLEALIDYDDARAACRQHFETFDCGVSARGRALPAPARQDTSVLTVLARHGSMQLGVNCASASRKSSSGVNADNSDRWSTSASAARASAFRNPRWRRPASTLASMSGFCGLTNTP
jgi:hypothetical protein